MKAVILAATAVITASSVQADDRLDGRLELMKLAYACDGADGVKYTTARDAALRAEQMATVGAPDKVVLGVDRGLRDGSIVVDVKKVDCAKRIEQLTFDLKAIGAY